MVSHRHKNEIVRPLQMEKVYIHEIEVMGKSGRLQLLRWKKKEGFLSDVFLCVNKDILRHVNIVIIFSV